MYPYPIFNQNGESSESSSSAGTSFQPYTVPYGINYQGPAALPYRSYPARPVAYSKNVSRSVEPPTVAPEPEKLRQESFEKSELEIEDALPTFNEHQVVVEERPEEDTPTFTELSLVDDIRKDLQAMKSSSLHNPHSEVLDTEVVLPENDDNEIADIFIGFFRGERSNSTQYWKNLVNGFISSTGSYTHCELIFKFKNDTWQVATVSMESDEVEFKFKPYDYYKWHLVSLRTTPKQKRDLYTYCIEKQGCKFNSVGMLNFIPLIGSLISYFTDGKQQKFFCSELILHALQSAKIPGTMGYYPCLTTPEQLLIILKQAEETNLRFNVLETEKLKHLKLPTNFF